MRVAVIVLIAVGAGWFFFGPKSDLEVLMEGSEPFVETSNSGIFDIRPSRRDEPDVRDFSESGHITVVEFYDPKCRGCTMLEGHLQRLNKIRPDVAIKLIHVSKNYYRYWGNHYGLDVPHVPFTVILDTQGEILAKDHGHEDDGEQLLEEWLKAELRRR